VCILTRVIALLATAALSLAVLYRSPTDYRMAVCVIVCVAATTLVVRCLFVGKILWALPFLGILGMFTPFQVGRFSHPLISIVDMMSLALFAISPMILRRSAMTLAAPGRSR
jgi:hypothetical protein